MKHRKLTFVGLLALPAAAPDAFGFGPPGPPPMGGGLPVPPMGGRSSVRPNIGVRSTGRARRDAKSSIWHAMLAAIFLVAGTSSAAFGDETSAGVTVLRGTPARVEQPQKPQPVQLLPPPRPSCPEGYFYSLITGYCYRPRDPLNPIP
jgi:hypothetical protein